VKQDINETFAGISFNSSLLPLPERNTITFCDQMDTSVIDDLGHDILKVLEIGIILIVVLAVVLLAGYSALEWYKWRCLKRHLERTRRAWMSDPTVVHIGPASAPTVTLTDHNLLILHADSTHPLLTLIANKISARLHFTPSQYTNLAWFFHYIFHPPALACFMIGFFGILSVQLQLWAVGPLEAKFHDRANAAVTDLSTSIFTSLNQSMFNQSSLYANGINTHVDNIQSTVNDGLFGWVNGTTSTLNDTLNTFYSDLQNAVSTLFNGTVLESPAQEFIACFIGSKVNAIEEALTFLQDNLHIDIPRVNESILVLSPDEMNTATRPIATAAVGNNNSPDGGLLGRLINSYVKSLKKERIMFGIFLGLWGIVVLMALVVIFWNSYGRRFFHARRKRSFERDQRTGIDNIVVPFDEKPTPTFNLRSQSPPTPSTIRRVNPEDPESFLPLPNVKHNANKSFDSFFDHVSPTTAQPQPPAPGGVIRTLSRKLRGDGTWRRRLTFSLWGDRAARKSFHKAHRPQLTISTERAASLRGKSLPEVEHNSPGIPHAAVPPSYEPKSVWSPDTAPMPINPGARRKPSVPVSAVSASGEADSNAPSPAAVALAHMPPPLHYGYARAAPATARKVYIPPSPGVAHVQVGARALAQNPFATPFDDDAAVVDFSFAPLSSARDLPAKFVPAGRAF
jgi:hypothetical protein